ncbi:hypothetical protein H0484_09500 [Pusillimonas sp. CC-YST705]|uniref:Transmembrane protein n=1 Tax=Mesopusillimonas faecipullorum TaxID=2755040 RepID=A0ABS8CD72_9BURK|nr:hypothetical protein [Mesopusillimonas faecipullorum]MCB5363980.1 hypothetical protein [Mesopusillimonas faecipullorum]
MQDLSSPNVTPVGGEDPRLKSAKTITTVIYALQAASFFVGITGLVAIIINYVKLSDVQGTWLASHFRWQIRTFWFGLLWGIIGAFTIFLLVGYLILLANAVWIIYRIVRGWLNLADNKPMYI